MLNPNLYPFRRADSVPGMGLDVVLLEPWNRGSHQRWAQGLAAHSRHRVHVIGSTDDRWRRALRTNPVDFGRRIEALDHPIDCLIASTPIDLPAVLGHARRSLAGVPCVLYAHETQVAYPAGPKGGQASPAMAADWGSMLVADVVVVASRHHKSALEQALPPYAAEHHDVDPEAADRAAEIASQLVVIPQGVTSEGCGEPGTGPPRILWNHRWAHDKAPERFVHAMNQLAGDGLDFEILALGEVERSGRAAQRRLVDTLPGRIACLGHQHRHDYDTAIRTADIVVSTARHEFFGVAVAEAIAAGARPLLPDRLAYPELIPPELSGELLYRGALSAALRPLLTQNRSDLHRHQRQTLGHIDRFSWDRVVSLYDDVIESVVVGS